MALLDKQLFKNVGISPAFVAATATGDTFENDGTNYLFVKNASAAAINVTVDSFRQCSHGFDHDLVVSVPAGATEQIGPFDANRYTNDNGQVSVTYSAVASVTVAVVQA
jgi:hypothetical protein